MSLEWTRLAIMTIIKKNKFLVYTVSSSCKLFKFRVMMFTCTVKKNIQLQIVFRCVR